MKRILALSLVLAALGSGFALAQNAVPTCPSLYTEQARAHIVQYKDGIAGRLNSLWAAVPAFKEQKPLLFIHIARNGNVVGVELKRTSGNAITDQKAVAIFQKASPFPPLPNDFYSDHLEQIVSDDTLTQPADASYDQAAFDRWLAQIQKQLVTHWHALSLTLPPVGHVRILMWISADTGEILQREIVESSCNSNVDTVALQAIDLASPVAIPQFKYPMREIRTEIILTANPQQT